MQQDLFIILIEKHLAGKASEQEIDLLDEYYNRLSRQNIQRLDEQSAAAMETIMLTMLQDKIHVVPLAQPTGKLYRLSKKWWAAAAVILVAAATFFLNQPAPKQETVTQRPTAAAPKKILDTVQAPTVNKPAGALQESATAAAAHTPQNTITFDPLFTGTPAWPNKDSFTQQAMVIVPRAVMHTWKNPAGHAPIDTLLADGTHVWLNEGSVLQLPQTFAINERKVELNGEAYFEVTHKQAQPFRVKAGNDLVEDVGTSFNINTKGPTVRVTLVQGIVKVNGVQLRPGQQYNNGRLTETDAKLAIAWRNALAANQERSFTDFAVKETIVFEDFIKTGISDMRRIYLSNDTSLFLYHGAGNKTEYNFTRYSVNSRSVTGNYLLSDGTPAPIAGIYRQHTLWTYDFGTHKMKMLSLLNGAESSFTLNKFYYTAHPINNGNALASGSDELQSKGTQEEFSHKLDEVDLGSGKLLNFYGTFNNLPKSMSMLAWKQAYEAFLYVKPSEDKAVKAMQYTDRIEIFDLKTKTIKVISGPDNYTPGFTLMEVSGRDGKARPAPVINDQGIKIVQGFKVGSNPANDTRNVIVMGHDSTTRRAFEAGVVNDQYIYLLYSGNPEKASLGNAGKYVFVYDWNGNPIKKYTLDRYVTGIAITADGKTMYAYDRLTGIILKSNITPP